MTFGSTRRPGRCKKTSAVTGEVTIVPFNFDQCIEHINTHIRTDKKNQLLLRTALRPLDVQAIRDPAANRGTYSAQVIRNKMMRESIYHLNRQHAHPSGHGKPTSFKFCGRRCDRLMFRLFVTRRPTGIRTRNKLAREDIYQRLVETSPDTIFIQKSGSIRYVSQRAEDDANAHEFEGRLGLVAANKSKINLPWRCVKEVSIGCVAGECKGHLNLKGIPMYGVGYFSTRKRTADPPDQKPSCCLRACSHLLPATAKDPAPKLNVYRTTQNLREEYPESLLSTRRKRRDEREMPDIVLVSYACNLELNPLPDGLYSGT
ncbi:hypothetical protein FB45DRAFT_875938 [Roridomyces roridus]|uniref:DUF8205 domain-containing protein n=1 Tax=Roridomyces roridus TaxID=1738132 RepID=A0AAD7FBA0_9AGAR|nr:hypothetical protein FB45DRAFT_875938 [Roridomyces roridus]